MFKVKVNERPSVAEFDHYLLGDLIDFGGTYPREIDLSDE